MVVLAAGASVRLGAPKALARIRGSSLIRGTISLLAPLAGAKIIVVVPPRASRIRLELRHQRLVFIENRRRAAGLSTSVRLGLRRGRYGAGVMLLPVDLALLERRDVERLIARWHGARRKLVARRIGDRAATPLIVPRRLCGRALEIRGDQGLKDWVSALPAQDVALVDLPSAAFDVDTPNELRLARRLKRTA
jgi:molybdenum cofactor cytidylyltransferase